MLGRDRSISATLSGRAVTVPVTRIMEALF
jgi:hypothetical protein